MGRRGRSPAATVEDLFRARTAAGADGHLRWTGYITAHGVPAVRWGGRLWTARRIAYRIRTGRDPVGYCLPECGERDCVAPAHIDDAPTRTRDRAALAAITGVQSPADTCRRGHGLGHRRYRPDGRPYCRACAAGGQAVP